MREAKYLLVRGAAITTTLTSDWYTRFPLNQGGLEIPCNVKVTIAHTEKGHFELVTKP